MAIKPIVFENKSASEDTLTIGPKGLTFSAKFIKSNNLERMQKISFLTDDENDFWLGFKFHMDGSSSEHLTITFSRDAATRRVASAGIISKMAVLKALSEMQSKESRTFDINFDKLHSCWFVQFRPAFERRVRWEDRSSIPNEASGIYRYFDVSGSVIYIGKGLIKSRLSSLGRENWGISRIEYSIVEGDAESLKWESFYLDEFKSRFGLLPTMNRVSGHSAS